MFKAFNELVCSWCMSSSIETLVILDNVFARIQIFCSTSGVLGSWGCGRTTRINDHHRIYSLLRSSRFANITHVNLLWLTWNVLQSCWPGSQPRKLVRAWMDREPSTVLKYRCSLPRLRQGRWVVDACWSHSGPVPRACWSFIDAHWADRRPGSCSSRRWPLALGTAHHQL